MSSTAEPKSFARAAALVSVATVGANALFYLASAAASRALGPADYSAVASMLSLVAVLVVPAYSLQLVVARHVTAALVAAADERAVAAYVRGRLVAAAWGGAAATAVLVAASAPLKAVLDLDSVLPVIAAAAAAAPLLVVAAARGALQAEARYLELGRNIILEGAVRFAGVLVAIAAGAGVAGIAAAPAVAAAIATVAALITLGHLRPRPDIAAGAWRAGSADWRTPLWFGSFALLTNLDLLIARAVLPEHAAGNYAAAALFGKIILFLPLGTGQVLLRETAAAEAGARPSRRPLIAALALTGAACAAIALVAALVPWLVGAVLVGDGFAGAEDLYAGYGLAAMAISLAGILAQYDLALARWGVAAAFAVAAVVAPLLLAQADTAAGMLHRLQVVAWALLVVSAAVVPLQDRRAHAPSAS